MHALRNSSWLTRLVLAWFVLTLGIAVASPVVQPKATELVCSSDGGMKLVAVDFDGDGEAGQGTHHTLDCPLCLATALPASLVSTKPVQPRPHANARHPFATAHIVALPGAPLPPRGPPLLS